MLGGCLQARHATDRVANAKREQQILDSVLCAGRDAKARSAETEPAI